MMSIVLKIRPGFLLNFHYVKVKMSRTRPQKIIRQKFKALKSLKFRVRITIKMIQF